MRKFIQIIIVLLTMVIVSNTTYANQNDSIKLIKAFHNALYPSVDIEKNIAAFTGDTPVIDSNVNYTYHNLWYVEKIQKNTFLVFDKENKKNKVMVKSSQSNKKYIPWKSSMIIFFIHFLFFYKFIFTKKSEKRKVTIIAILLLSLLYGVASNEPISFLREFVKIMIAIIFASSLISLFLSFFYSKYERYINYKYTIFLVVYMFLYFSTVLYYGTVLFLIPTIVGFIITIVIINIKKLKEDLISLSIGI